jgi:hypothetical protein
VAVAGTEVELVSRMLPAVAEVALPGAVVTLPPVGAKMTAVADPGLPQP